MAPLVLMNPPPLPDGDQADLEADLLGRLGSLPTDAFGHAWIVENRLVLLTGWDTLDEFREPALLFLDESRDERRAMFFYGALAVPAIWALVVAGRHVESLAEVRRVFPEFWPEDRPPPRLHFRELYPKAAREKTTWRHLSEADLAQLVQCILPALTDSRVARYLIGVTETRMERAMRRAFPDQGVALAIPDLRLQCAALMVQMALGDTVSRETPLEVVADYDDSRIRAGKRRWQATRRFLDRLGQAGDGTVPVPTLHWAPDARYSSRFPSGFTWERATSQGYAMRPLVHSVWLQFVDLYLALWRKLDAQDTSILGVRRPDLGQFVLPTIDWIEE